MAQARIRIVGLDVARGLAILGMFAAHTVHNLSFDWARPETWSGIVDGRSAILFATLAGISLGLMSGGRTPVDGIALVQARTRILIRAVLVFAIGGVLAALGSGIAIILEQYAVIFVLSLPFLRWRPRRLFVAAAAWAVVGPILAVFLAGVLRWAWATDLLYHDRMRSALTEYLATGLYPVLVWVAFMFLGLGIGRLAMDSRRIQLVLLAVGAGVAAVGYALGAMLKPVQPAVAALVLEAGAYQPGGPYVFDLSLLLGADPHSGTPFEVVGSGGFAVAVIALCLLVTRLGWVRAVLTPLSAMGQMALTIYTAQVIAFWIYVLVAGDTPNDWLVFGWFAIVSAVVAMLWRTFLGQGPLERLLATVSRRAADPAPRGAGGDAPAPLLESPVRPGEGATAPSSTSSEENLPHG